MKRNFTLFLVVPLIFSLTFSHAETVCTTPLAPKTLHEEFLSPQNVCIHINASIALPDTTRFPTQEVGRRIVSQNEILAMADAAFGTGTYWAMDESDHPLSPQPHPVTAYQKNAFDLMLARVGNQSGNITAFYEEKKDILHTVQARYTPNQHQNQLYVPNKLPPLSNLPNSIGTLSLDTARKKALDIAHNVNENLLLSATNAYPTIQYTDMDLVEYQHEIVGTVYVFHFTHRVDDAHVTYEDSTTGGALDNQNDTYTIPFYYEQFWIALNESGIMGMEYVSPYEILGTLTENSTLLPFDSILSVAKSTLPLKYALSAKNGKITLNIDRIVLGYTRITIKNAPHRYQLIPAWDFMGYVTFSDGYAYGEGATSLLCINALDGTVIDRDYGY